MPAPLFLLVYFAIVATTLSYPQESATLLVAFTILKLLRRC